MIYGETLAHSKTNSTPKPPVCVAAAEEWHHLLILPTARRRVLLRRPPRHSHNHSRTRPPTHHLEISTQPAHDLCQVSVRDLRNLRKAGRTSTAQVPVVVPLRIVSGRDCRVEDPPVLMLTLVFGSRLGCPEGEACMVAHGVGRLLSVYIHFNGGLNRWPDRTCNCPYMVMEPRSHASCLCLECDVQWHAMLAGFHKRLQSWARRSCHYVKSRFQARNGNPRPSMT